jgi:hypothetical protein
MTENTEIFIDLLENGHKFHPITCNLTGESVPNFRDEMIILPNGDVQSGTIGFEIFASVYHIFLYDKFSVTATPTDLKGNYIRLSRGELESIREFVIKNKLEHLID